MANQERNSKDYQAIAGSSAVFNTETGYGDRTIIRSLKHSARLAARQVFANDPTDSNARALLRWANSKISKTSPYC